MPQVGSDGASSDGGGLEMTRIESEMRAFIAETFIFQSEPITIHGGQSLIRSGVIDSMGILEIVLHLEEAYGIQVSEEEMIPANLDTINNLVSFILAKSAKTERTDLVSGSSLSDLSI